MCGIVGFIGHSIDEARLRRAIRTLHHRGPDGQGVYIDSAAHVGLGHARLSIIDLETGGQPLYSEDNDVVLVCNGEIYDFEQLRDDLEAKGHRFRTRSDSEVIIHLYQEYGLDLFKYLRGEFAILLYDVGKQVLLAIRDRFGIKPLFFNEQDGRFLFASEAKAIFATGQLRPQIDPTAIRDYLSGVIPDSILEGVCVVPPGQFLKVDVRNRSHELVRYWDLDLPSSHELESELDFAQASQTVREVFDESVRLRLRADVPVGVYLSGGMDSAIVAATVAKYHPGKVKAFNISFPEDEAFDEYRLSKEMAEHIGAEFHSVTCDRESLLKNTEDCLWCTELPFPNFHGVGKFMLSRLAREHVTVVLTGEGSDEVFLGYVYFQPERGAMSDHMENRLRGKRAPGGRRIRAIVEALGFLPMAEHAASLSPFQQRFLGRLFHRRHRDRLDAIHPLERLKQRIDRSQTDGRALVRRIQYFSFKSMLAPYILTMLGDRAELAHSIEGRTPFLDHHLVEAARHIPDGFKIRDGVEKYVLRETFKDRITDEIYRRNKWPFVAPPLWMKRGNSSTLDKLMDSFLSKEAIEKCGLFNYGMIRRMRWFYGLLFFDCFLKRSLNLLFILFLSIHIIDRLFVQEFDKNVQERAS